jgi:4-amino-4-deoxy-L-arabinose transferase-like glycosyltransferase
LALLLVVALAVFFAGLGRLPLLEPDEGRNAEVAREMLASGDWVTPHFNSLPYLDKPAPFFWLVAASFRLWGITEWAARFPSALLALALGFLVWFLARRMFGPAAGLRAGIILACCPLGVAFARLVIFDMMLTFLVTLALASFWWMEAADFRRPWLDVLLFAAMGLATITKGPVGFLLPLLTILAYLALGRRLRDFKRLRWGLGLMAFFAVALPWFIAACLRNPGFARYALWDESLRRFAGHYARRAGSIFYYVPVYLAGWFPWSCCLLFAGWNKLKQWRELGQEKNRAALFLLTWAGVFFLFFTVSGSKLPGYVLPAMAPLSILLARAWDDVARTEKRGGAPDWLTAGLALVLGCGLLLAVAPQLARLLPGYARFLKKLHPALAAAVPPTLLYSGLILVALAIIGRNLASRLRGPVRAGVTLALLALVTPLLVVRWLAPLKTYASVNSSRRLAETILASPEKTRPLYGYYYFRTGLPFYLRRPVGLVTSDASELTSNCVASRYREWQRSAGQSPAALLLEPTALRARAQASGEPILMLVRNTHVAELARVVGEIEPLWTEWQYSVWVIPSRKALEDEGKAPGVVGPFETYKGLLPSPAVR